MPSLGAIFCWFTFLASSVGRFFLFHLLPSKSINYDPKRLIRFVVFFCSLWLKDALSYSFLGSKKPQIFHRTTSLQILNQQLIKAIRYRVFPLFTLPPPPPSRYKPLIFNTTNQLISAQEAVIPFTPPRCERSFQTTEVDGNDGTSKKLAFCHCQQPPSAAETKTSFH